MCHTHLILRNDAFRVLKQNGILKVLGDPCVAREQGTGHPSLGDSLQVDLLALAPQEQKIASRIFNSDLLITKVEGLGKVCYGCF